MDDPRDDEIRLVAEREAEMGPESRQHADDRIDKRVGFFLGPNPGDKVSAPPFAPSVCKNVSLDHLRESKVLFRGWGSPLRKWGDWVDKLRPRYGDLWEKAGILNAVVVSTYKIKRDYAAILGVAAYWCGETSTFVFPWGEATVTLEDMMVLGGLPVLGEPVRGSLSGELAEIEQRMIREHRTFNRSTSKKADQSAWMRHFIEGDGGELEHVAFLALWLSRFVFPGPPIKTVKQHMLPIAVRLARGIRIALGPSVLASFYRDLRLANEYLVLQTSQKADPLVLWAPFDYLQVWLWEHFLALRPDKQNLIDNGEPRIARWHDVGKKSDFSLVVQVLESSNFLWRPYAISLENWTRPSFYRDDGMWVRGEEAMNEELRTFAQCLKVAELVGVDCVEQYLPHRVAMQFGLDQDLPCHVPRYNSTWEIAWGTYDITSRNVSFYIPAQFCKPSITLQYSIWWKQCIPSGSKLVETNIQPQPFMEDMKEDSHMVVPEKKMKKFQTFPSTKKRKLQEFYDAMLSDCLACGNNSVSGENDSVESENLQSSATESENFHLSMTKEKEHVCLNPSSDCVDKIRQNFEMSQSVKSATSEPTVVDASINEDKPMMGDFNQRNGFGSVFEYVVPMQPGVNSVSDEAKMKLEQELEKRIMMKAEESALEMQIKLIKEEIAVIEARAMELEPVAEVHL